MMCFESWYGSWPEATNVVLEVEVDTLWSRQMPYPQLASLYVSHRDV